MFRGGVGLLQPAFHQCLDKMEAFSSETQHSFFVFLFFSFHDNDKEREDAFSVFAGSHKNFPNYLFWVVLSIWETVNFAERKIIKQCLLSNQ